MNAMHSQAVGLALLLGACGALANVNPCTGLPAAPPYYTDVDLSRPWPACASPTLPRVDANSAGVIAWRWCKGAAANTYAPQWAVIPWSDFQAQPALALKLTAAGLSMNEEALKAITAEYAALIKPLAHPSNTAIWCPLWPKIAVTRPVVQADLPATSWIVAKNGTSATRPTYPVLPSGRRSPVSNGSVAVGVGCNVSGAVVETPLTFGLPVGSAAGSVALCVRR